jgi:hypothetical protein
MLSGVPFGATPASIRQASMRIRIHHIFPTAAAYASTVGSVITLFRPVLSQVKNTQASVSERDVAVCENAVWAALDNGLVHDLHSGATRKR